MLIRNAARHDIASTRIPPTNGPRMVVAADAPAHRPKARPSSSPWKVEVMMASDPGTKIAPAAPWSTRKTMSRMMLGANPHISEVTPKATSPMANIFRRPK